MDTPEFHDPAQRGKGAGKDPSAPLGRKVERPNPPAEAPAADRPERTPAPPEQRGRGQSSRRAVPPAESRRSEERPRGNRGGTGRRDAPAVADAPRRQPRDGRGKPPREGAPRNAAERRPVAGDKPFRPTRRAAPRRPDLPDERPFLPRDAWRDLRATVPAAAVDDVVKAVGVAAQALESGDLARATELLEWAKSAAPRSGTIREALGVVHYQAGRFAQAQSELLTYRRLSGSHDQNHLLADCVRATGRPEKADEYVDEMIAAGVEPERVAEGLLVLAGVRADRGDFDAALQTLHRAELDPDIIRPWHPRLWYAAADLLERMGQTAQARDYFEAIQSVDEEFGDVDERLAALGEE